MHPLVVVLDIPVQVFVIVVLLQVVVLQLVVVSVVDVEIVLPHIFFWFIRSSTWNMSTNITHI